MNWALVALLVILVIYDVYVYAKLEEHYWMIHALLNEHPQLWEDEDEV